MGKLVIALFGMILVGAPMVFFVWHELSEALLGRPAPGRLAVAAAVLVILFAALARFGRFLVRLDEHES